MAPPGHGTRPTADKVREGVFNSLDSAGLVDGAQVADLFAGSGAMGIEALSRGAASCVFVETDRSALAALRENLAALQLVDRSRVVTADVLSAMGGLGPVDLALVDPPYRFERWDELLRGLVASVVVAESDREVALPEGWELERARRYGRTFITVARRIA